MSESMIKIWINGLSGRVGQTLFQMVGDDDTFRIVGGSSSVDDFKIDDDERFVKTNIKDESFNAVIDFSTPEGNAQLLNKLTKKKWRNGMVVIATTNIDDQQLDDWKRLIKTNKLRVVIVPNASVGANIFIAHVMEFSRLVGTQFSEIEITEKHHAEKKDAPSGTAIRLAEAILKTRPDLNTVVAGHRGQRKKNEIAIHSLRGGAVIGEHSITFMNAHEEITMTHRAESRDIFAQGSLVLVKWLSEMKRGGFYTLDNVFGIRL